MGTSKKIAIISPYLDVLGGGERYVFSIASVLSKKNKVTLFWHESSILNKAREKFGIELSNVSIKSFPHNRLTKYKILSDFDTLIYMTDGSLFFSPCKENILIIQSPAHIPRPTLSNKLKLKQFNTILCYSEYVSQFIKTKIKKTPTVLPPPITNPSSNINNKQNIIVSVGRFFPWLHSKRQDLLIDAFKELIKKSSVSDWKLVLIGSVDKGASDYIATIKRAARGYPVEILTDADFKTLISYYQKAKLYWHGAGFEQDLEKYPENAEHFGITTVEAMSYGCVPIVFNAGGQKEIVTKSCGFLWNSKDELIDYSIDLIKDDKKLHKYRQESIKRSNEFNMTSFTLRLKQLIN